MARLLARGMLVGVAAAVLAFVFATVFGEPQVESAIAFEGMRSHGDDGAEVVARGVQSTLGLGVAVLVYGAALGGVFALAFAFVYGRVGRLGARGTALAIAAVGFVAVALVPFLKYPANPPAVGSEDTIGRRTALYFTMLAISAAAAIAATLVGRELAPRLGAWDAILAAAVAFVVLAGLAGAVLPAVDEVPAEFPGDVLWRFRVSSIGMQAVLWATFGLLFGALTARRERRTAPRPAAPATVPE